MKHPFLFFSAFLLSAFATSGQLVNADTNYDIVWNTPSANASESMPCGGGDIGMNVWVENGDLLIYVARSGNFDENNALMKTGRLRIKLFPNPFSGKGFRQQLHLQNGCVTVEGEAHGIKATVKIWADVMRPVAQLSIESNKKIAVHAAYESWRFRDRVIKPRENFGNSWKWAAPKNNVYKKDEIDFDNDQVVFYHHNAVRTIFDTIVDQQGMSAVKNEMFNPLRQLAFGGVFGGRNFVAAGTYTGTYVNTDFKGWQLNSKFPAKAHQLSLYLHNAQVEKIDSWKAGLDSLKKAVLADAYALKNTLQWWADFWNRSFIHVSNPAKDSAAWEAGRNYQLFRYMLACNARGAWPSKFNGGLFTVDPVFTDRNELTPDYRNWGGGLFTAQNQRLVYFPMIKSGDWDMMQAQLDFYTRLLHTAELRSQQYWKHDGACFTEQMENFGLPNYAEYGQKRPEFFDKGLEYNAWLEYEWDTVFEFCLMMLEEERYTGKDISERVPFISSCLRFFDEHYQYLARHRGNKALDGNGKLVLYPGSAAETFKMATNATSTVAALQTITRRLLALPGKYSTAEEKLKWQQFLKRIPDISYGNYNGHVTLAPARQWERINNVESPQLYPVFPWGIFGVGKPGLDTALNTWYYDSLVVKFRSHLGWKQDNIWAAHLGLRAEAWRLTQGKLQNSERRFPAFWGPGFDWVPDLNWGGSAMIGLQDMLLQTDGNRLLLFPAWPKNIDVHFKLHAPNNTLVEAAVKDGQLSLLKVTPQSSALQVELMLDK